ncbi:GDNF family receptor alpha-2-like [Osmerus mordax]|uniref:GDNF family receptor alpha-2-like n=1 Tax=Osmerus mordax TaxID=8014 RepID=UPI0035101012
MNCLVTQHTVSSCPNEDNYQACLASYTGLIGTDATPNYVDGSYSNWTVSPWCTCAGSGNQEGECENFLRDFTDNTCLRNAIQAFGYGVDSMSHKADPVQSTPTTRPASEATPETSEPTYSPIDMPPGDKEDKDNGGDYEDLRSPEGPPEDSSAWPSADPWVLVVSLTLALAQAPALLAL